MKKFSELQYTDDGCAVLKEDCDHWQRLCTLMLHIDREVFNKAVEEGSDPDYGGFLDLLQSYDRKSFDFVYRDLFKTTEARIECRKYPGEGDND